MQVARLLPHTWHQAIANLLRVLVVSVQLFLEQLFFVADASGDHQEARDDEDESPVGTERKGDAHHHDHVAGIHRVPHQPIHAGGD